MALPLTKPDEYYTYEDYATWPDDVRYELMEGTPYLMTPAPNTRHQGVSMELSRIFSTFLHGHKCRVFASPIDVRLNIDTEDDTVLQPDLIVVCDKTKIGDKSINGAPDLVIEIQSPTTAKFDRVKKYALYEKYGVKEYWIVDHIGKVLEVFTLENGKFIRAAYGPEDTVEVGLLPGLAIDLSQIFSEDD